MVVDAYAKTSGRWATTRGQHRSSRLLSSPAALPAADSWTQELREACLTLHCLHYSTLNCWNSRTPALITAKPRERRSLPLKQNLPNAERRMLIQLAMLHDNCIVAFGGILPQELCTRWGLKTMPPCTKEPSAVQHLGKSSLQNCEAKQSFHFNRER